MKRRSFLCIIKGNVNNRKMPLREMASRQFMYSLIPNTKRKKAMKRTILLLGILAFLLTACGNGQDKAESEKETEIVQAQTDEEMIDKQDGGTDSIQSETGSGPDSSEQPVSIAGPYGSIQITMPEEWKYEICPVDDEKLIYGDYGVHIYPEDAAEGFVEIVYKSFFGVCGTGLREEEKTIADDTAFIGYYDDSDIWSFVVFEGRNKHIVAQTYQTDGWWDERQEEVMEILDTLVYDATQHSGAIGVYDAESEMEEIGLLLSAKNVTPTGAVVCFHRYGDDMKGDMFAGRYFRIEKKDGDIWDEVKTVSEGEHGFTDEAFAIAKGDALEIAYDWEWLYGALPEGEYRIVVHVTAEEQYDGYAHFMIG